MLFSGCHAFLAHKQFFSITCTQYATSSCLKQNMSKSTKDCYYAKDLSECESSMAR